MSAWDNFKLGLAGVADAAAHALGIDSHWAASTWAEQEDGGDPEKYQALESAAIEAEGAGTLGQAAELTEGQIGSAAKRAAWWAGGGLAMVGVLALVLAVGLRKLRII